MANFKGARAHLLSTPTNIYTAPKGGAIIFNLNITTNDDTNPANVLIEIQDSFGIDHFRFTGDNTEIAPSSALALSTNKITLSEGESIIATASAGSCDMNISIMEFEGSTKPEADRKINFIGEAGGAGFGVGIYPFNDDLKETLKLAPLYGYGDPNSDNYGNYIHTNGSIVCYVPKFYYRIGHIDSPNYSKYGDNAIDIESFHTFRNESDANAKGYALPRAFIDNSEEKLGFFFDKYVMSKHGDVGKSVRYGIPISLTTVSNYTNSSSMPNCDGNLKDAVTLSRARGTPYNSATGFMYGALWILQIAHAQSAESDVYCAWYDENDVTNYTKGCNTNLTDTDDNSIEFISAEDSGDFNKPLAGSGSNFAKTTHNGQNSGIADLNGTMWEVGIGLTIAGTSSSDSSYTNLNELWVLNELVKHADLTEGFNDGTTGYATDIWGVDTHLDTLYTKIIPTTDITVHTSKVWGNSNNPVFFNELNGTNRALSGLMPLNEDSLGSGTNLLGNDRIWLYSRSNLCMRFGAYWGDGSNAGLGARSLFTWRTHSNHGGAARAAAYGQ